MSWLLPSALGLAGVAAVAAIALHFIARSRPLAEPLPTARFVPLRPIHARTRSLALSDVLLLVLRLAGIAAVGLAIAGPVFGNNGRVARIFIVDRSRAVASAGEVRDSVRALATPNDPIIVFDSVSSVADSVARVDAPGSLSAAIAAATRAAVKASADADSIELVLVSPLVREEVDDATSRLRAAWQGRIRLVPVAASTTAAERARVEVRATPNDAVAAGFSLMGVVSSPASVRLVRGPLTPADSSWAREPGHVVLWWPAAFGDADWTPRASIDAIGAVTSDGATVVARFPRPWHLEGNAIARWADGEPAAIETTTGGGCIRNVGVLIDQSSDLALREPFRRFARALLAPCGGVRDFTPVDSLTRVSLAGAGPLAVASVMRDRSVDASRWTPWLLVLGALLLTAEMSVRRSEKRSV